MTDEQKSFIYIEFGQLGSTEYTLSAEGITSSQLFIVADILKIEAEQSYLQEKMAAHQKALQQDIIKPSKGILKP